MRPGAGEQLGLDRRGELDLARERGALRGALGHPRVEQRLGEAFGGALEEGQIAPAQPPRRRGHHDERDQLVGAADRDDHVRAMELEQRAVEPAQIAGHALDVIGEQRAASLGEPAHQQRIRRARVGCGGVAASPRRATATEAALAGQPWTEAAARAAMAVLAAEFAPITDMRATAAYRREALAALLWRFWLETGAPAPAATRVSAAMP